MTEVKEDIVKEAQDFFLWVMNWTKSVVYAQIVLSTAAVLVCFTVLSSLTLKADNFSNQLDLNAKYNGRWGEATVDQSIPAFQLAFFYLLFGPYLSVLLLNEIKADIDVRRIWRMIPWVIYMFGYLYLFLDQNWYQFPVLLAIFVVSIAPFGFVYHTVLALIIVTCIIRRRVATNESLKSNEFSDSGTSNSIRSSMMKKEIV